MKNQFNKTVLALALVASHLATDVHAEYIKPQIQHARMCPMKAVIPFTTDNSRINSLKLMNMENMMEGAKSWGGSLELRAVLYSDGVDLLLKPNAELKKTLDHLRTQGVKFLICNNTLFGKDLDYHSLYGVDASHIVPSGSLEVVYLQQCLGYSVDPLN